MIAVYYDGKCGLCSKEIRYYQKIAPTGRFVWHDIANRPELLEPIKVSQQKALRRLHAQTTEGNIVEGVDAFCVIWKELSGWRWLGMFISIPVVRYCARFCYEKFADYRFSKLEHCQIMMTEK